jgi:hypothetical protein
MDDQEGRPRVLVALPTAMDGRVSKAFGPFLKRCKRRYDPLENPGPMDERWKG